MKPIFEIFTVIAICVLAVGCQRQEHKSNEPEIEINTPKSTGTLVDELNLDADATLRAATEGDWFVDVTSESGVEFKHHSGRESRHFTMIETFGAGIALFDFDVDGDLDLLCIGGGNISEQLEVSGLPCHLYRNDGNFHFVDITEGSGLDIAIDYSHGVTVGDINRDGFPDLLITCYGQSKLFINQDGQSFRDETTEFGLDIQGWHTAACLADVTGDGILDLYVTGYLQWEPDANERCLDPSSGLRDVCMPGNFQDAPDRFFVGQKDGTFAEQTKQAGILPAGKGLGIVVADFDANGHLDYYVANDVDRNHLYLGQGQGTFIESAIIAGVSGNEFGAPEGSMGVDVCDFNHDGLPDIFVTNYELEENDLYRNEGQGLFSHITVATGLAGLCRPYVGFGTVFLDADMDGWSDLFIANGHVTYRNRQTPYQQPAFLYRNLQGKRFQPVGDAAGDWFSAPHTARGVATGDLNNDGTPDLVISEQDGPVSILKNLNRAENWIGINPIGTISGTDVVGATVRLDEQPEVSPQVVKGGGSYLSYSDRRLLFSIPDNQAAEIDVIVQWPNNITEIFRQLSPRMYHLVKQGAGETLNTENLPQN
ncbi:MAG: CRTAC1 family protein [Planctomycetaceae bacterium]|nr:CRTAC1 family protein [Planctomycetaceae bacterium]